MKFPVRFFKDRWFIFLDIVYIILKALILVIVGFMAYVFFRSPWSTEAKLFTLIPVFIGAYFFNWLSWNYKMCVESARKKIIEREKLDI